MLLSSYLEKHTRPTLDTIVDIGANIGDLAVFLASTAKANVLAIEPGPKAFHRLVKRALEHHEDGSIIPLQLGISDRVFEGEFFHHFDWTLLPEGHPYHTHDFPEGRGHREFKDSIPFKVRFDKLDTVALQYVPGGQPSFVKIDVDGYELQVIRGGHETLIKAPFLIEVGRETVEKVGDCYEDLIAYLFKYWQVYGMAGEGFEASISNKVTFDEVLKCEGFDIHSTRDLLCTPKGKEPS